MLSIRLFLRLSSISRSKWACLRQSNIRILFNPCLDLAYRGPGLQVQAIRFPDDLKIQNPVPMTAEIAHEESWDYGVVKFAEAAKMGSAFVA